MAHRFSNLALFNKKPLATNWRCFSSHFYPSQSEYVDEPIYPEIIDLSCKAKKERSKDAIGHEMKKLPTVEEKLIQLNEPKYYGFWSLQLREHCISYNALPFVQFATRTALTYQLPHLYATLDESVTNLLPKLKELVSELILQDLESVANK